MKVCNCATPTSPQSNISIETSRHSTPDLRALPNIPNDSDCVIRGQVSKHDVLWMLRTRLDAVASMRVLEGQVTGWLLKLPHLQGHAPMAVAQVENRSMLIRAIVAPEDLNVVVSEPFVFDSLIPDGETDRNIIDVEDREAGLDFKFSGLPTTFKVIACNQLGLQRKEIDTSALLPPSMGPTVVRLSAKVLVNGALTPVSRFYYPVGVREPAGVAGELRGEAADGRYRSVSFRICGGTVLALVSKPDLLGHPRLWYGGSARCPNTGQSVFLAEAPPPSNQVVCSKDIPVFIRSETLQDPIGLLKAGTRIGIDGQVKGNMELVTIPDAPVEPINLTHFSVQLADLESCRPV